MTDRFKVLSLFSGALGLDLGLERSGPFDVLACAEVVPAFCETIQRNADRGRVRVGRVYCGDVSDLDPAKIRRDQGLGRGDLDLIVGGPPCQSFSTTGRRRSVLDRRGTMLWQYLRFVEALRPRMFILENVRGLMSAALRPRAPVDRPARGGPPLDPDEEPGSVLRAFVRDLDGYRVDCFEVNAVNYGAPQLRERVILVGNRLGRTVEFPSPTHGPGLLPYRTLGEALEGLHDPDPVLMDFSSRKKRFLAKVPPGGNWRSLPARLAKEAMGSAYHAKGGRSGYWRRLSFDLPCPTLVTMPNHARTCLCHPTETRALSLRECARVQGFPDDWEFAGTTAERYAQVGNAVPVRLGEVVGGLVARELSDRRPRRRSGGLPLRVVYVDSHVRTRRWFKDGRAVVLDGAGSP